jgi:hypothetical protein
MLATRPLRTRAGFRPTWLGIARLLGAWPAGRHQSPPFLRRKRSLLANLLGLIQQSNRPIKFRCVHLPVLVGIEHPEHRNRRPGRLGWFARAPSLRLLHAALRSLAALGSTHRALLAHPHIAECATHCSPTLSATPAHPQTLGTRPHHAKSLSSTTQTASPHTHHPSAAAEARAPSSHRTLLLHRLVDALDDPRRAFHELPLIDDAIVIRI